jgi:S-adenosyl methyltransferase
MTSLTADMNQDEAGDGAEPTAPNGPPTDIDFTTPSPARMYDYYLGGKDNFAVDRAAAEKALAVVPDGRQVAWANRRFLVRAVKYLARQGIEQFIDLGTGIPTSPNVHETARSIIPGARVAYVDNDPIVIVHDRALLASVGKRIIAVRGDVRYPLNILANHALGEVIDFRRPVGILFVAVLHFVTDTEDPYRAVTTFRDRVCPGSYVAASHITSDGTDPHVVSTIQDVYRQASAPAVFRSRAGIERLFDGFRLVKPGIVEVSEWRRNKPKPNDPPTLRFLGGVGRKP